MNKEIKKYYDPEYDRVVTEEVVKHQYEWFRDNWSWFTDSYEEFAKKNFTEIN